MASVPPQPRPHTFNNQGFLPNGSTSTAGGPTGGVGTNMLPNNGRVIQSGGARILCIADVRGNLRSLNELAKQARADHIIHTGDFGFYDDTSLDRIADKTLKHVAQYSPLLSEPTKKIIQAAPPGQPIKQRFSSDQVPLSELPLFLNKTYTLDVQVFTVWGACEDVRVLEKFRSGEYKVDKLHIIDEASSRLLDVGGVKLRLLGLGGAVVMHKLFDNGEGRTTIAGGQGTMWTTLLQMGELVDTANRVYDPTETRVFVTHASPAREGILNQLSVTLKADFSISAGLHFRYGSSYNEFSVNPTLDHYRGKLAASKASFNDVWETVKGEVEPAVAQNEAQQTLLNNALELVKKMPSNANGGNPFGGPVGGPHASTTGQVDESAFKNMWNFNLADAAFGWLVLEIEGGRIGTETRAQGFNFSHRGGKHGPSHPAQGANQAQQPAQAPAATSSSPAGGNALVGTTPTGPAQNRINSPSVGAAAPTAQHFTENKSLRSQQQPQPQQQGAPTGPSRSTSSPAPVVPTQQPLKPATPQPTSAPQNSSGPPPAAAEKSVTPIQTENRNGATPVDTKASVSPLAPAPKAPSPSDKKPTLGLWVGGVSTLDACRALFNDEEQTKILRYEIRGNRNAPYFCVLFNNYEDAKAALDRQPQENKEKGQSGTPWVKFLQERGDGAHGSAAGWRGGNRGGASANQGGQGGYKSGGGASDSESGRGRGNFRGGARGRGGDRGGRSNRPGRTSFNNNNKTGDSGPTQPSRTEATPSEW
ncbi:hypothetical protein GP486_004339 [Trichoglossum hirsutum]|uniref:DUF2433 domain-containing protein n=1 Tax=Trichoglossum hirsutum TaxID=265104 RepID=A0A9P8LBJ8_9PEZI|nr:hypothetical protein GP486_004339 [Trichoglossum hirsutum]